jgi:hypothetical protein
LPIAYAPIARNVTFTDKTPIAKIIFCPTGGGGRGVLPPPPPLKLRDASKTRQPPKSLHNVCTFSDAASNKAALLLRLLAFFTRFQKTDKSQKALRKKPANRTN